MRSVCVCRCGFGARFALGFAHELAVLAGCLTLVHACVCGSVAVFCVRCVTRPCGSIERFRLRFTPVFFPLSGKKRRLAGSCVPVPPGRDRLRAFSRRWCGCRARLERGADLRGDALSVAVFCVWCVTRPCGSVDAFCLRFTPVFFPLSGKKRRLAGSCVPVPPGRDRLRAFSRRWCGYQARWVHFGLVRLFVAISTGYRGRWRRRTENGAGGAAFVRLCAITLALQCFPRGVRWGYAPQTAPKSLRLSGLSSGAGRVSKYALRGGVGLVRTRILAKSTNATISAPTLAKPGYTERPDRL